MILQEIIQKRMRILNVKLASDRTYVGFKFNFVFIVYNYLCNEKTTRWDEVKFFPSDASHFLKS